MTGKLIIFSAPSGAGKTTIVKHLLKQKGDLAFSISVTSRAPRTNEINGVDYHFLSKNEFEQKIENGDFLEWEEVYEGAYYGTLKADVENILERGRNVLLDVDVAGALNIKRQYGSRALAIFIEPPSLEELRRRLSGRSTDSPESINQRVKKAEYEMSFAPEFDIRIVNDDLKATLAATEDILKQFIAGDG